MLPRAIVFDAVGTLIHADPPVADVYHLAGWEFGSQLSRDDVSQRLRAAFAASEAGAGLERAATSEPLERERWRQLVRGVFADVPDAGGPLFETLWRHFAQSEHWRLFHDVAFAINELAGRGVRLAIASNFDRRLHAIRQALAPLDRCERCFVSSEVGYPKPDRRFFSTIEQQLGLAADEILLVGDDRTNDILGARAAGWQAALLARKGSAAAEPAAMRSLSELLELLSRRKEARRASEAIRDWGGCD
ncbi:MAG: HAD-IA family hydrolase [Pirellulaceae bacterium]